MRTEKIIHLEIVSTFSIGDVSISATTENNKYNFSAKNPYWTQCEYGEDYAKLTIQPISNGEKFYHHYDIALFTRGYKLTFSELEIK